MISFLFQVGGEKFVGGGKIVQKSSAAKFEILMANKSRKHFVFFCEGKKNLGNRFVEDLIEVI